MTETNEPQAAAPERREEPVAAEDRARPRQAGDPMSTTASQRVRLVPPDGKPRHWTARYRRHFQAVEWIAALAFFLVACYYLYLWLFPPGGTPEPSGPPPSVETFRAQLRSLPAIQPDPAWAVPAAVGRWRSIVLHHSATDGGNPESFDRYHREVNKWENGLGYHFVIGNGNGMPDGQVAMGHRWTDQLDGAHVKNSDNPNSYSIGICLVGNFDRTVPTARQLAALKGLLAFLRREYNIGLAAIVGHDTAAGGTTDCPGDYFFVEEVALVLANP